MSRALSPFVRSFPQRLIGLNLLNWVPGALLCMGSGRSQGLLLRTPWPVLFWFGSLSFRNWRLQVWMKEVPCFHELYHCIIDLYYNSSIPSGCCLSGTGSYYNKCLGTQYWQRSNMIEDAADASPSMSRPAIVHLVLDYTWLGSNIQDSKTFVWS